MILTVHTFFTGNKKIRTSEVLIYMYNIVIAFSCSFVPIDMKDQTRHYILISTDMAIGIIFVTEIGSLIIDVINLFCTV